MKRASVLGLCLTAVLISLGTAVACGGVSPDPHIAGAATPPNPAVWVPSVSSPSPISPSSALARVVASLKVRVVTAVKGRQIVARRERTDLVSARIGTLPLWAKHTAAAHAEVPALYVTEKIASEKNGDDVEPTWEADLLAGAVAELAGKSGSLGKGVGYAEYAGRLPDGKVVPAIGGGGMGDIARGQQFAGAHEADTAITKSVEQVALRFGLSVNSVMIFRAWGAAPAVVLTAPDARTARDILTTKGQSLLAALFGTQDPLPRQGPPFVPRYEGYYLEIRNEHGTPFVRQSQSWLTGTSGSWSGPVLTG